MFDDGVRFVDRIEVRVPDVDDPQAAALADRTDQAVRMNAYRTAAGEVEARNVEARQAMSPAGRRDVPPWQTQDVPDARQWIPQGRGDGVTRAAQLARVVANSGGEGQRIASEFYAARPGQVDAAGRAAFGAVADTPASPAALGAAVQDAARTGVAATPEGMALTEARAAAGPRVPAQYGGAGFASAVAGNPQQRRNLEAAIRALPEGDTLWTGLDRFLTTLRATGYRPQKGSDTAFNARIQDELQGGRTLAGAVGNALAGSVVGAGAAGGGGALAGGVLAAKRSASDAFTRYQMGRNGEAIARMLFDPAALRDLRHLARSRPGTRNALGFTARLLALAGSGTAPTERTR